MMIYDNDNIINKKMNKIEPKVKNCRLNSYQYTYKGKLY